MSNKIEVRDLRTTKWVWADKEILFSDLVNATQFKAYGGLASYAGNQNQTAWPSLSTLAKRLHMGRSTLIEAYKHLEEIGAIQVDRNLGVNNVYSLLEITKLKKPSKKPKKVEATKTPNWVKGLLIWAEDHRKKKFTNYGKQVGWIGKMKNAGYTEIQIKEKWAELEKSDFWKKRGFDFHTIAGQFDIRPETSDDNKPDPYAHLKEH